LLIQLLWNLGKCIFRIWLNKLMPDWSWSGDLTADRFWENDNGFKLVSYHWFGDTEVRLFYRQSHE